MLAGAVVLLDTLNRVAPIADENSPRDMGETQEAAKQLQGMSGGMVVLVQHTGKDATKGLRGHSSRLAAMDVTVEAPPAMATAGNGALPRPSRSRRRPRHRARVANGSPPYPHD